MILGLLTTAAFYWGTYCYVLGIIYTDLCRRSHFGARPHLSECEKGVLPILQPVFWLLLPDWPMRGFKGEICFGALALASAGKLPSLEFCPMDYLFHN